MMQSHHSSRWVTPNLFSFFLQGPLALVMALGLKTTKTTVRRQDQSSQRRGQFGIKTHFPSTFSNE